MASTDTPSKMYKHRTVRPPTMEDMADLSKTFGFGFEEGELEQVKEYLTNDVLPAYETVDVMVAPTLPVKYPRVPGHRPEPEDNKYNAWLWRCDIQGAAEGPLKGKRVAIKDSMCIAGVPLTNGSRLLEDFVPDIDATVVTRILDAGGQIVGTTSCEHLCFSGSSWTNDNGPILNPHDQTRTAGGSSGGSAVVVHTGEADMALGGDQGGSVRMPASWCGIVGLKPTWGLVPYTGAVAMESTCDHLGPMAKTVQDCALLLEVIAGFDEGRDPRQQRDIGVPKYSQLVTGDIAGKRVGLVTEGFEGCEAEVQKVVRDAANSLTKAGATVEEISLPCHTQAASVWAVICWDGTYRSMVQGNGYGYHSKGYYPTAVMERLRAGFATKGDNLADTMKIVTMFGEYMSKKYGNKFYAKAQNLNMKMTAAYNKAFENYDVLVMPTMPFKAPLLPNTDMTLIERVRNALNMVKNTGPFNSTGFPALSINAGFCDKLPVGMMIVGKLFDDVTVMQVARGFEKIRDGEAEQGKGGQ